MKNAKWKNRDSSLYFFYILHFTFCINSKVKSQKSKWKMQNEKPETVVCIFFTFYILPFAFTFSKFKMKNAKWKYRDSSLYFFTFYILHFTFCIYFPLPKKIIRRVWIIILKSRAREIFSTYSKSNLLRSIISLMFSA